MSEWPGAGNTSIWLTSCAQRKLSGPFDANPQVARPDNLTSAAGRELSGRTRTKPQVARPDSLTTSRMQSHLFVGICCERYGVLGRVVTGTDGMTARGIFVDLVICGSVTPNPGHSVDDSQISSSCIRSSMKHPKQ
jgi:hypothetical protein